MLPITLTRYFADSRLELESFSNSENRLAIRVEKEIGPEKGVITFQHVSFMLLSSFILGEAIRARPVHEAGPEFWARCLLDGEWFDRDDVLFEIESQDGPVYFVVAKSVGYEIQA